MISFESTHSLNVKKLNATESLRTIQHKLMTSEAEIKKLKHQIYTKTQEIDDLQIQINHSDIFFKRSFIWLHTNIYKKDIELMMNDIDITNQIIVVNNYLQYMSLQVLKIIIQYWVSKAKHFNDLYCIYRLASSCKVLFNFTLKFIHNPTTPLDGMTTPLDTSKNIVYLLPLESYQKTIDGCIQYLVREDKLGYPLREDKSELQAWLKRFNLPKILAICVHLIKLTSVFFNYRPPIGDYSCNLKFLLSEAYKHDVS
jgi:hypothetical protein